MKIHLATDHAGLELKDKTKQYLIELGNDVIDHGAYEYDALDDYPDYRRVMHRITIKGDATIGIHDFVAAE